MAASARRLPRRPILRRSIPLVEPVSSVDAPFHRSGAFYVRVGGLAVVALALLGVLALRLWSLEVLRGPRYAQLATRQAFRIVDLPGPRGGIVDAKGRLLAGTNGRLAVTADRSTLGTLDAHGRWEASQDGLMQLQHLARVARVPLGTLVERLERAVARSPYAPAVVLPRPTRALAVYIEERPRDFRGFHVTALPARRYPQGRLGSEFLGLLGEVSPQQLESKGYAHAQPGEVVGQSGVEAAYDRQLNGGFQRARLRVDSEGRILGPLRVSADGKPLPTLHLTIDAHLQRAAERAIQHGIELARANGHTDASAGAAVVMDAHTGGLYALASYPDYNQTLAAHDPAYYRRLLRASPGQSRLLNRATQGLYPTGSTFKPIVAEAALATGLITPSTSLLCSGSFTVGNFTFHNVEAGVFSYMSLPRALAESCDTWFYRLGEKLYLHQQDGQGLAMQNWAHRLGLGHPTGLDLPSEAGRHRPDSRLAAADLAPAVVRGSVDQPLDRPGLSRRDAAAAGRRILGARQRRGCRPAARDGRDRPPGPPLQARPPYAAHGRLGDPGRPLRRRPRSRRHVGLCLRELPDPGGGQDGNRPDAARQRPLLVRIVGAGLEPPPRRRGPDRARRLRRPGSRPGRHGTSTRPSSTSAAPRSPEVGESAPESR